MTETELKKCIEKLLLPSLKEIFYDTKENLIRIVEKINDLEKVFCMVDLKVQNFKVQVEENSKKINEVIQQQINEKNHIITLQNEIKSILEKSYKIDKIIDGFSNEKKPESKTLSRSFFNLIQSKDFWLIIGILEFIFFGQVGIFSHFVRI